MEPEIYFLKYAYPCSHILCAVRKEITKKEFNEMENAAINNIKLEREFLEKVYWRAFERINKLTKEMGKEKWDIEVIKEYFLIRHNDILDNSDYPESFKEMCKVFTGEVIRKTNDGEIIVKYKNNERKVKTNYLPEIKIGDKVTIHWQYAIEKIEE